jgi:lipopolysaccharide export system protein LptA
MAASILKSLVLIALMAPATQAGAAAARAAQQPILLEAQSSDVDLRTHNAVFTKVHISQGTMSIAADQGHGTQNATALNFDDNLWVFHGNVKILTDQGQLTSEDAQITFVNKVLTRAVANGKPAAFEQRIDKTGKTAHANAENINYDVDKHIVRLSKNASVTDGQDEIHGESLKYDVLNQRIIAEAAEQGSQRVHIIITPPPPKPGAPGVAAPAPATGAPPTAPNP